MMIAPATGIAGNDLLALCTILEEMVRASKKLMTLLQDEKRLIIEGNIDHLIRLSSEKEAALEHLDRLNKDRMVVLRTKDKNDPPPSLRNLIPLCPDIYRKRLQTAHTQLEALSAGINELNQMNGLLTDRILQQISGLLGVLTQLSPSSTTYAQSGMIQAVPTNVRTFGKG